MEATDWLKDAPLEDLLLRPRTYRVLRSAGIQTVWELLQCDERTLLRLPYAGRKSLADIRRALGRFIPKEAGPVQAASSSLGIEPYQTCWRIPTVIRADLDAPIEALDAPLRIRKVLAGMDIHSVRDLLLKGKYELLKRKHFGRKSFNELQSKVYMYLSAESGGCLLPDLGIKAVVETMLSILPQRYQWAVARYYGLWDGAAETERDIGSKQGVTRERIRQIVKGSLIRLRRVFPLESIRRCFHPKLQKLAQSHAGQSVVMDERSALSILGDRCSFDEAMLALRFLDDVFGKGAPLSGIFIEVEPGVYCLDQTSAERHNRDRGHAPSFR